MRARKNERTYSILSALRRREMTADQLAKKVGARLGCVRSTLTRLSRYGHVDREKVQDGTVVIDHEEGVERPKYVYVYGLTEAGSARMKRMERPK